MFKYHITIEYDGTNFVGWQFQKNGISIQEVLQNSFFNLLKEKIIVIGSGRTDAGVHGIEQSAHIESKKKNLNSNIFLNSINFYLKNHPITLLSIKKINKLFHARYSAKKRVYIYLILNRDTASPLSKNRVWFVKKKLDIIKMKKATKILKGTHDFSIFRSSSCQSSSPIKTLKSVNLKKSGDVIAITFASKSFYNNKLGLWLEH